jgi:type III pantothenate kinase
MSTDSGKKRGKSAGGAGEARPAGDGAASSGGAIGGGPAAAGGGRQEELLVLLDVGNTNTVVGVQRGEQLIESFRLSTDAERTGDEYGSLLLPLFSRLGIDPLDADAVVISSVVPPLHLTLDHLSRRFFGKKPMFVELGVRTGMPIRYDNPKEVGADRVVNSVAARDRFGAPVIVVDFGTATTFDVVNAAGEYIGGIIAPGIGISAEALFAHASRLFRVDVRKPDNLVGKTTASAMQAGLYYGYVGLVDGILERLLAEIPGVKTVVATGGQADLIASGSKYIRETDPLLTLYGLKLIYERNR